MNRKSFFKSLLGIGAFFGISNLNLNADESKQGKITKFNVLNDKNEIISYVSFTGAAMKEPKYIALGFQYLFRELKERNKYIDFNEIKVEMI